MALEKVLRRSSAETLVDFRKEIQKGGVSPAGKAKTFYRFVSSHGAIIDVAYDDMKHAGKHNLTDEQIQAIEENSENFLAVYQETKRKGHYGGIPILAKIKTPVGNAGVVYELLPNGRTLLKTMFFDTDSNIDHWMKKGESSRSLLDGSRSSFTDNRPSIQSIQKELGIVNAGSESPYLSQEEIRTQKEAVRKQYEGTAMWMKAPNGKDTNLTEEQWLLVRTPAFKAWFGDWEAEASLVFPRQANSLDEAVKEAQTFVGHDITNHTLGITAILSKRNIGKMTSAKATTKSVNAKVHAAAVANIDRLFKTAIAEYTHKDRANDPNIQKIHRMFSPFTMDHEVFVAKLTVKELAKTQEGNRIYSVEAVEIKEASPKWNAAYNATKGLLTSFPQEAFEESISKILAKINTASKVVDENGEPLVVYHGSDAQFDVFDSSKGRSGMDIQGMFFSPWEDDAQGYGKNVRAFFLNIKHPADDLQYYEAFEHYKGQNYAGIKAREELIANGYDGVNVDGEEYIAFEPTQIKSVDNNGNFDPEDANIYHQEAVRETAEERANRISQEVFQTYLNDGIMKSVEETVAAEIGEYVNLDAMADPVEKDKVRDHLPYIKALLVQFNSRTVQKNVDYKDRYAAKIEYARRCFDNDERIKAGATRQMVGNEGQGDLHQNRNGAGPAEHKRGNGAAVQRLHGRISAGISNQVSGEKRGAREHFEKLYNEIAKKHSEKNQGAFSHGLLEQAAWHGSPYRFLKFLLDAIGSGEGAAAKLC